MSEKLKENFDEIILKQIPWEEKTKISELAQLTNSFTS